LLSTIRPICEVYTSGLDELPRAVPLSGQRHFLPPRITGFHHAGLIYYVIYRLLPSQPQSKTI